MTRNPICRDPLDFTYAITLRYNYITLQLQIQIHINTKANDLKFVLPVFPLSVSPGPGPQLTSTASLRNISFQNRIKR